MRQAVGSGFDTKTIMLSCGKPTTGITVPQWSSILMLRNLKSPETCFQAAFRVQSPWSIKNPNGDDPNEEEILKPVWHCEQRSDEAIHLRFHLDCPGRLRLPSNELPLFVIASPTGSGVAIQLNSGCIAASLRFSR